MHRWLGASIENPDRLRSVGSSGRQSCVSSLNCEQGAIDQPASSTPTADNCAKIEQETERREEANHRRSGVSELTAIVSA